MLFHVLCSDVGSTKNLIRFGVAIAKPFHFVCRILGGLRCIVGKKENFFTKLLQLFNRLECLVDLLLSGPDHSVAVEQKVLILLSKT